MNDIKVGDRVRVKVSPEVYMCKEGTATHVITPAERHTFGVTVAMDDYNLHDARGVYHPNEVPFMEHELEVIDSE